MVDRFEEYRGIHVAVLGASGFIGRWVTAALHGQGAHVSGLVRDTNAASRVLAEGDVSADLMQVDLRSAEAVRDALRCVRPSIVFNLTGYGVDRSEQDERTAHVVNTMLPQWLVEAMADLEHDTTWAGQQVVHVGSALEYGTLENDLDERSQPCPTTLYGRSKLAGTLAVREGCQRRNVRGATARLFTVYGPGEHAGRLLPSLLETASTGQPLPLTAGRQQRDFTYVEDVAEGLLRLGRLSATPEHGYVVNLATGALTSVRVFAETAAEELGIPRHHLQFGAVPTRTEEMVHLPVATGRLQGLLGWLPTTSIAEGIRRTRALMESSGAG